MRRLFTILPALWFALYPVLAAGVSTPGVPHSVGVMSDGPAVKYPPSGGAVTPPPSNSAAPVASGTAIIGATLTTTNGTWTNSPSSYTYQWQRNGVSIPGATASTYVTVSADGGTSVLAQVTASNGGGSASANSNALSILGLPANTAAPVASGSLTVGSLLSTTNGTWSNSPTGFTYQWQGNGASISGATASSYTTVTADGGTSVGSQVTASNASGAGAPALSNTLAISSSGCTPPACMVTPILQSRVGASLNSTPTFSGFFGGLPNALLSSRTSAMAIAGTVSALQTAAAAGSGITTNNVTYTLYKNGVATALQCSVGNGGGVNPGTATGCTDNNPGDAVSVVPGDTLVWGTAALNGNAVGSGPAYLGALFTSTVGQESLIGNSVQPTSTTAIMYSSPAANNILFNTDFVASIIMPTAGTFSNWYGAFSASLGANKLEVSLFKNGVKTALDAICTGSTSCSETSHSVSVVAGDTVSIQFCPGGVAGCVAGSAPAVTYVSWSMRWAPTTPNQALALTVPGVSMPLVNTVTTSGAINTGDFAQASDVGFRNVMPVLPTTITFSNLWVAECPGPDSTGAGGVTRTLWTRLNAVTQTLAISMPGNAINACPTLTVASDTTHSFSTNTAGLVGIQTTLNTITNGVAATAFKVGAVMTVP